jgi:DNA modification methylase
VTPFVNDNDFTLYVGDALDVLQGMPDESVHCVVTSPPYWGLRSYIADGHADKPLEMGLEPTPDAYIARMVEVFREIRRVLRRDGTCWINLGDSYAGAPAGNTGAPHLADGGAFRGDKPFDSSKGTGLKPKDLVGIPWRLAFALQADGWYLRSDIIWSKPNPMPESVTDRPTKAHEYVFLLTRSARYFYDADAIREPHQPDGRIKTIHAHAVNGSHENYANMGTDQERWPNGGRNARSVWTIATQPYAEAHFATFPEELPRRCIAAGTSERGCCPECGAPWEREVEVEKANYRPKSRMPGTQYPSEVGAGHTNGLGSSTLTHHITKTTTGWRPSCNCGDLGPVPAICLDPFMGSGTVALVARKLGRCSIGIELSPAYARLAAKRLQQQTLFA